MFCSESPLSSIHLACTPSNRSAFVELSEEVLQDVVAPVDTTVVGIDIVSIRTKRRESAVSANFVHVVEVEGYPIKVLRKPIPFPGLMTWAKRIYVHAGIPDYVTSVAGVASAVAELNLGVCWYYDTACLTPKEEYRAKNYPDWAQYVKTVEEVILQKYAITKERSDARWHELHVRGLGKVWTYEGNYRGLLHRKNHVVYTARADDMSTIKESLADFIADEYFILADGEAQV